MGLPVPSTEVPSLHPRAEVHPEHVAAASSAAGDSQDPAATGTKQKVKHPVCVLYLSLSNHLSIHDLLFLTCGFFLRLLSVDRHHIGYIIFSLWITRHALSSVRPHQKFANLKSIIR